MHDGRLQDYPEAFQKGPDRALSESTELKPRCQRGGTSALDDWLTRKVALHFCPRRSFRPGSRESQHLIRNIDTALMTRALDIRNASGARTYSITARRMNAGDRFGALDDARAARAREAIEPILAQVHFPRSHLPLTA
jgi:hypothetical protein